MPAPTAAVWIDGALGEGGGQVLRSSLSLSMITGRPVTIDRVRAGRRKPGLLRQHLLAVQAAAAITGAQVEGAELGSQRVLFAPGELRGGTYRFAIGSAGSTTLVAQTLLLPLSLAPSASDLLIEGGTHNPLAPPFDFLARSYLPVLAKMGVSVDATIPRYGFMPAGGGCLRFAIRPSALRPIDLLGPTEVRAIRSIAIVAGLDESIGARELDVVRRKLDLSPDHGELRLVDGGPGNALTIDIETAAATEVVSALGRLGYPAERVASNAVRDARAFLRSGVPVGEHLADQLLLPLALAGGGSFHTVRPSGHTVTNARVIEAFLPLRITLTDEGAQVWRVAIERC